MDNDLMQGKLTTWYSERKNADGLYCYCWIDEERKLFSMNGVVMPYNNAYLSPSNIQIDVPNGVLLNGSTIFDQSHNGSFMFCEGDQKFLDNLKSAIDFKISIGKVPIVQESDKSIERNTETPVFEFTSEHGTHYKIDLSNKLIWENYGAPHYFDRIIDVQNVNELLQMHGQRFHVQLPDGFIINPQIPQKGITLVGGSTLYASPSTFRPKMPEPTSRIAFQSPSGRHYEIDLMSKTLRQEVEPGKYAEGKFNQIVDIRDINELMSFKDGRIHIVMNNGQTINPAIDLNGIRQVGDGQLKYDMSSFNAGRDEILFAQD